MDTINYDAHNMLLNGQPYPLKSVRPIYPTTTGDNVVTLLFPWWRYGFLWRGDVTQLVNGRTGHPFHDVHDFRTFFNKFIA